MNDPLIAQIGETFRTLRDNGLTTTDGLLIDGLRTALAANLISHYSQDFDRMIEPGAARTLDSSRLRRVFDLIESQLDADLSLDDLAAEACISPFHFARLFRESTGLTPHRFVTVRRVGIAKESSPPGICRLSKSRWKPGSDHRRT